MLARGGVHLPDRRAFPLPLDTVLGRVAIRAHRDVEPPPVWRRDEVFRLVVIARATRQVDDLDRRRTDISLPSNIREAHHGIGDAPPAFFW